MGYALKYQQELITETCCNCFVEFAMPVELRSRRLNDHQWFYCPNGHGQNYTGETEAEKLRKQLEAEKKAKAEEIIKRWEAEQKLAKMTKRANAGVCQHCSRTFQNVARHMASKHKDKK